MRETFTVRTRGRGTYEITDRLRQSVRAAGIGTRDGLCHVFVPHTSASLIFCENADSSVRHDLERFFARLVPDGDPLFSHTLEGPDDMPAHLRSILTQNSVSIPIQEGDLAFGTWQGLFLWEHRAQPHERRVVVTVLAP